MEPHYLTKLDLAKDMGYSTVAEMEAVEASNRNREPKPTQAEIENPAEQRPETCEKHGAFVSKRVGVGSPWECWTECPACEEEKKRESEERRKREEWKEFIAKRVKEACIPPRFLPKTLADYKPTVKGERDALLTASNYVEAFEEHLAAGRCLVFCGSPGTGKTHLACAIAKSLAQSGRRTRYLTVTELIDLIRATWQPGSFYKKAQVLQALRELDLLVLDEVGVQFGTEAERAQLTEVMDLRYRDIKPTLVVSNCTKDGLKACLGDRIVDRLRENGGKVVIFDWPSRRG